MYIWQFVPSKEGTYPGCRGTAVGFMIPPMPRQLITALACALAGVAPSPISAAPDSGSPADSTRSPEELILPAALQDIDGRQVDLAGLVRRRKVVVVTMKGPWCQVCKRQLVRLRKIQSRLSQCGAAFVVLSPGPRKEISEVRRVTGFSARYVEDVGLKLARGLGLQLAGDQIQPAIFRIDRRLRVTWMQAGRSGRYYGDGALWRHLDCGKIETVTLPIPADWTSGQARPPEAGAQALQLRRQTAAAGRGIRSRQIRPCRGT